MFDILLNPNRRLTTSDRGIAMIKKFEGLRLEAYFDAVGVPTIGYGHTKTAEMGTTITEKEAERLLRADLSVFEKGVGRSVTPELNQHQFDALVSFAFNVGLGNFNKSTLLKKVNSWDIHGASREFPKWKYASGRILNGLVKRRRAERKVFDTGTYNV